MSQSLDPDPTNNSDTEDTLVQPPATDTEPPTITNCRIVTPASRVLLGARKGSRQPMRLLPALVLHDAAGRFTPEAEAVHRGEGLLPAQ